MLIFTVIGLALVFDFINGFHDTANSIATIVGTKVLTPRQAIVLAAVTNLIGALAGQRLRSAAQATGVGSTVLLSKILTRTIIDPPRAVLDRLAQFLNVTVTLLSKELGPQLALHRSYKATDKPTVTAGES